MITLLLRFWFGRIGKYYTTRRLAKLIITGLFGIVFLFVAFGVYAFFVSGFRYINVETVDEIRLPLSLFIYEQFLVVLAGVIAFSSMISGLFNLFRGDTNAWVMSSPGFKLLPTITLLRSLFGSTWPLLVVFLPAMLALHRMYHPGIPGFLLVFLSIVPLALIINLITLLLIVGVALLLKNIARLHRALRFTFKRLVLSLLIIIALVAVYVWKIVRSVDLIKLFRADNADAIISLESIGSHFRMFPTHPFALELVHWQSGDLSSVFLNFITLSVTAGALLGIWYLVGPYIYPLWQILQEGSRGSERTVVPLMQKHVYRFRGGPTLALFKKEALVLSRNFKGILWLTFLFTIWMLQVGMNVIVNSHIHRYELDISQKKITFQIIQYIIAIYFMSAFTLRFVFPSFSVEKKTAWILASAPLNFKKIFFGKYLFYILFFLSLGVLMSFINSGVLGLSFTHAFFLMLLFIATITFIVTAGLALGALFPSTETDDPEAISTSMSGLSFTALALIYGAISDGVLYLTLTNGSALYLLIFVVFTLLTVLFLLLKTPAWVNKRAR